MSDRLPRDVTWFIETVRELRTAERERNSYYASRLRRQIDGWLRGRPPEQSA